MLKLLKQGRKANETFQILRKQPNLTHQDPAHQQPESFEGRSVADDIPAYLPAPLAADLLSD